MTTPVTIETCILQQQSFDMISMKLGRNQRDSKPVSPPAGGDFSTPRPEPSQFRYRLDIWVYEI
ncbi:hypothetical protein H2248_002718 [Termitomyces sp. 'cryptogamus']|nr:hypothetical protein H2248_002718 [Termitomyces sp. 'cryptogamus']